MIFKKILILKECRVKPSSFNREVTEPKELSQNGNNLQYWVFQNIFEFWNANLKRILKFLKTVTILLRGVLER